MNISGDLTKLRQQASWRDNVDDWVFQGEEVKKPDVLAYTLFINMLRSSYASCLLVS